MHTPPFKQGQTCSVTVVWVVLVVAVEMVGRGDDDGANEDVERRIAVELTTFVDDELAGFVVIKLLVLVTEEDEPDSVDAAEDAEVDVADDVDLEYDEVVGLVIDEMPDDFDELNLPIVAEEG